MSRNCPDNASVMSRGHGLPRASSFNIEPVPETDSEEQVVLDSLPLGAVYFKDPEQGTSVLPWAMDNWREHYPYWKEPHIFVRASIGDCYVMMVDSILMMEAPFPGDQIFNSSNLCPELRFHVYRDIGTLIKDQQAGDQLVVNMGLLENENFNVSGWFAEKRSRVLGLIQISSHQYPIGDAIAIVTRKLLTDGVSSSYPCTNDELNLTDRFWVQRAEGDADEYLIVDVDPEVDISIPKAWLKEPTFDLVSWYRWSSELLQPNHVNLCT